VSFDTLIFGRLTKIVHRLRKIPCLTQVFRWRVSKIAQKLARGAGADSAQVSRRPAGSWSPLPQPSSLRSIAEEMDVPETTIREAMQHVETAETYPFMQSWPQYQVLEARTHLLFKTRPPFGNGVSRQICRGFGSPRTWANNPLGISGGFAKHPAAAADSFPSWERGRDQIGRSDPMGRRHPPGSPRGCCGDGGLPTGRQLVILILQQCQGAVAPEACLLPDACI
jgi:hypothetical protein